MKGDKMSGAASRTENAVKNILWGYISNFVTMLVHFVSRTVFVYTIGVSYLGINGLFSSVLGMLSLTELGIGTAINYSLYKPVAEGDREKVKSLMRLYKNAYRVIALIITLIGLVLLPFLPYLVKDAENIPNVTVYYLIFLFNTVSTYFVSYKYGLVNAEQKGYIVNNFNSAFSVIITLGQIAVLALFGDYMVYLVVQAILQLVQKISIGIYLNRRYPYLGEKEAAPLPAEEVKTLKKNIFALMIHKIGEISVYQTDNIIISAFISVIVVGKISNYNLVITSVTTLIGVVFNSMISSIGNLIALESKERQKEIFDVYNFVGFWLYGFSAVCYWVLFQPFIQLWVGAENQIDGVSLALIVISQYLVGQRLTVNNMKTAGGVFEQDKYVSLMQGAINLAVSLVMVCLCGLPGVYIGTVVSGLYANIVRPIVVYRYMFGGGARQYFVKFVTYLGVTVGTGALVQLILSPVISEVSWVRFVLLAVCCVILTNAIFFIIFFRSKEWKAISLRVVNMFSTVKGRLKNK